jgi:hypothetical protein
MAYNIEASKKVIRFFLIIGVFDKPARASFFNIISSNGYYGCLRCLQPGLTENHVHCYKFIEADPSGPINIHILFVIVRINRMG